MVRTWQLATGSMATGMRPQHPTPQHTKRGGFQVIECRFGDERLPSRFWSKVSTCHESGCWLWNGCTSYGYGMFYAGSKLRRAHRVSYETLIGPIPDGLQIDHLCRVRNCVNPAHLEPVTNRENSLRGIGPTAINARAVVCKFGHRFTDENTYRDRRGRECRTCREMRQRVRQSRRPQSKIVNKGPSETTSATGNRVRRAARRAQGLCIDGNAPATHGVRCLRCKLVRKLGTATAMTMPEYVAAPACCSRRDGATP